MVLVVVLSISQCLVFSSSNVIAQQKEVTKAVSNGSSVSSQLVDVTEDYRPSAGKVMTYVNGDGKRVIRQEMVWGAERIAAIQKAYGSPISSAVTYEHGFSFNDSSNSSLGAGVWVTKDAASGVPVAISKDSNLPEWYLDTRVLSAAEKEIEVTFGTANAKKLEANKLYYAEIVMEAGSTDIDNAKLIGDLGYHFAPCLGNTLPPFCIDDRHHWTIVPAWEISIPGTLNWNTEGIGTIGGRVYWDGTPASLVSVDILMNEDVIARGKTDQNGYYEIGGIPAQLKVAVLATGYNIDGTSESGTYFDPSKDVLNQKTILVQANQTHTANVFIGAQQCGGQLQSSSIDTSLDCTPTDTTPPTASGYSISLQNGSANLVAQGVSDSDSGIQRVQFSAKWNGEWHVVGSKTTSPYNFTWNMCASGVPDIQIEFGLEVWDNAGNNFLWSEHANNPLATKSFNCNPSGGTTTGSIKLYSLANNGGSVVWSGETGFSNGPNANSYALSIPSGWSARVWRGDDRGGEMRCFSSSVPNLQDHGWHLAIQSIEGFNSNVCGDANTGLVVMCADGVGCWQFGAGYQPLAGFNMNDIMTSVYAVPSNMSVMLYREGRRRGTVECYNAPRSPLPSGWPWDLYKQATDAYVFTSQGCPSSQHGTVLFYSGKNHEGHIWSAGNEPGVVNMSDLGSREYFNDSAESMRIPPDKSVVIYADDNKGGEVSVCLTGDQSDLGNFNNKVSSVEMFDNTNCKPSAPTSLTVIQTAPTSIWLAWNHPTMNDVAFKVYRWNGADFSFIAQTEVGSNSYLDENLPCNSDQFYKLSAVTGRGESAQIGWIHAKTDACLLPGQPELQVPNIMTSHEGESIYFAWNQALYAEQYKLDILGDNTYSSDWIFKNYWIADNVKPNIYIVQITAKNAYGEVSNGLNFLYVKVASPIISKVESPTCSSIKISWQDYSNYEAQFFVYRDDTMIATVPTVAGQSTYSYLDELLDPESTHTYRVVAELPGQGEKSYLNGTSGTVVAKVKACSADPVAPDLLSPPSGSVIVLGQSITFSWTEGVAESYELGILSIGGTTQPRLIPLSKETHSYSLNDLPVGQYQWIVNSVTGNGVMGSAPNTFTVQPKEEPRQMIYLPLVRK